MDLKFKEKHYKKGRFNVKSEQELSQFKKDNITQDLNEIQNIVLENIKSNQEILSDKKKFIEIPEKNSFNHISATVKEFALIAAGARIK